ncbi:MAG TPA: hypothetical protein PK815_05645, partial [Verrucomicrobiota bacterium]|nr:hypothetical protein [Verrucomicrobiota bacterium]
QIDGAAQQLALENKLAATATVTTADLIPYLKAAPVCPAGGANATFATSYTPSLSTNAVCQIDATHVLPPTN